MNSAFLIAAAALSGIATAGPLAAHAAGFRRQLAGRVLPYWASTTIDGEFGGYLLADDLNGRGTARDKQLVSQARMVWGFSHAHLNGFSDDRHDYLAAAAGGCRFLLAHFRDPDHGGYFWTTDLAGRPLERCKFLYGQAFAVYALVEYHRAGGGDAALARAMELYREVEEHMHDAEHGGWNEHAEADWKPLPPGDPRSRVEIPGLKSANAHLHWMEALSELYAASRDPGVRRSLEEALRINRQRFYPPDPARCRLHCRPDWSESEDPRSAGLSYGHNVEFAWLMVRAQQVLGVPPSWEHFDAHLDHALRCGTDNGRGGLYATGTGDRPASDTTKVWWAQAEMMAALSDSLRHRPDKERARALEKLVHFVLEHQVDPRDSVWIDTVAADGRPLRTAKAHSWKANYHDLRAIVKFIEAFRD
jgi:mannobiose 2-epimerase